MQQPVDTGRREKPQSSKPRLAGFRIWKIIGSGGPVGQKSREQIKAERDEENTEQFRQMVAFIAEEERERKEWSRTKSSIGGVEMTGAEWAVFADRLRNDEELGQKIIDAYEAQGMSEAEANRRYERVTNVADAMKAPPSQRTEEQTALIEKSKNDPSLSSDMKTANAIWAADVHLSKDAARSSAPKPFVASLEARLLAIGSARLGRRHAAPNSARPVWSRR